MQFEQHQLPADGNLVPLLRDLASKVFVESRNDAADQSPWDWTRRLYEQQPSWRDHVDDAFAELLLADDPLPQMVLEQVTKMPVRSFLPSLFNVIGKHSSKLRRADSMRSNGQTILGSIVRAASSMSRAAQPGPDAMRVLASIDERADGWPEAFRLAFAADPRSLASEIVPNLQKMSLDERRAFVRAAVADGPPWTKEGFEAIARGPSSLRADVAQIVGAVDDELEQSKSVLASMDVSDDPEMKAYVDNALNRQDPWPEHAARLGVAP
jgi:hypothetical protein